MENILSYKVCIVSSEVSTVLGNGAENCYRTLFTEHDFFRPIDRFDTYKSRSRSGATMPELDGVSKTEIMDYFLDLIAPSASEFPSETELFLACTVGDIEHLDNVENRCTASLMLEKALKRFKFKSGRIISAACASSNTALDRAASLISRGRISSAFIISADHVGEFLFSGFASLKAMSLTRVKPYGKNRDGLLLGDACGCIGLGTEKFADENDMKVLGVVEGSSLSCDAWHITAPLPDGYELESTIRRAVERAGITPEDIGCVIGHGTGTRLNDAVETLVMERVFGKNKNLPALISIKGSCGHTLAGSGVLQTAIAVKILENGVIPPQTPFDEPEELALKYVSCVSRKLEKKHILTMNSGFGGVNAVAVIGVLE